MAAGFGDAANKGGLVARRLPLPASQCFGGDFLGDHRHHATLASQVERIKAQHLADRPGWVADGNGGLVEPDAEASGSGDFMADAGQSASSGVAHETQAGQVEQGSGQWQHRGGVGAKIPRQSEGLACQHHRRAVITHRPGNQQLVTWPDRRRCQGGRAVERA